MAYEFNPLLRSGLQKLQDVFKGQFILKLEDGTEVNLTDVLNNINTEIANNKTTLTTKLDKQQGADNFGKVLAVGRDGIAIPQNLYSDDGYQPYTKAEKQKLATLPTQYGIDVVGTSSGYLKSYQLYRMEDGNKVFVGSKVDIPQDFFLKEVSKVVVTPESPVAGLTDGTYFKFVFVVEGGAEEVSYQRIDAIVAPVTAGDNHVALNEQYEVTVRGFLPIYYDFADVPESEDVFQYLGEFDGEHYKGFFYQRTEDGWQHIHVDNVLSTGKDVTLSDDFAIPAQHLTPQKGMTLDNAVGNLASYSESNDKRITELENRKIDVKESKLYMHYVVVNGKFQFYKFPENARIAFWTIDTYSESHKKLCEQMGQWTYVNKVLKVYHKRQVTLVEQNAFEDVYYLYFAPGGAICAKAITLYDDTIRAYSANDWSIESDEVREIGSITNIITGLTQVSSFSGYTPKSIGECVQYVGDEEGYDKYALYFWTGEGWQKVVSKELDELIAKSHTQNTDSKITKGLQKVEVTDTAILLGHYPDTSVPNAAVICGNGTAENPHNAWWSDWNGNIHFEGDVEDGSGNILSKKASISDYMVDGQVAIWNYAKQSLETIKSSDLLLLTHVFKTQAEIDAYNGIYPADWNGKMICVKEQ